MPAWVLTYFIAYLVFSAWSVANDLKSKAEPLWFSVAEIFSDACLVLVALSFWHSSIAQSIAGSSLAVFVLGLAVLLGQTGRTFYRQVLSDPELSFAGKVFVGGVGSSLVIAISAPLVFWGFKAAVLGAHSGT